MSRVCNTEMVRVSVVLPVYNAEATLGRSIRSILDQSLTDLELIVVDDGSTDGSAEIAAGFADPRVHYIHTEHRGVSAAANEGTQRATAPFIARMDADDWAHPQRLELQLERLLADQLDVVGSRVRIVDANQSPQTTMLRYQRWINEETLSEQDILALRFVEFPLVNPTIFARRHYFELGFAENDLPEDYDLMLRAAQAGFRFGKVDQVLLEWTDHPQRLTRVDDRYSDVAFTSCRQTHLLQGPLQDVTTVDLWGVGKTGKPWLRWLQSVDICVRHLYDVDRRKVDQMIHGVRVEHPSKLAASDGSPLLIAVGADDARGVITPQILAKGYTLGENAWFVA